MQRMRSIKVLYIWYFIAGLLLAAGLPATILKAVPAQASQATGDHQLQEFFEPKKSEYAALSPDGKYLAFSERDGEKMYISLIGIEEPEDVVGKAIVGTDMTATPYLQIQRRERTPSRISWMHWVTPDILLLQTNQRFNRTKGAIITLNVKNWEGKLVVDPTDFINRGPVRILDFDPDNEEQVFLKCGGYSDFDIYALNVRTGKLDFIRREQAIKARAILFNRQFEAGITIPRTSLAHLPYRYFFFMDETESLFNKWKPLEEVIRSDKKSPFVVTYENFLRNRSIPIGFNEDGTILYIATNAGRETYAIKALDLETGSDYGFLLEDDSFDMVNPVRSLFPDKNNLVYDRYTREFIGIRYNARQHTAMWLDDKLSQLQDDLESLYPDQSVDILEWNVTKSHYLVRTYSHADRGAIHVVSVQSGPPEELVRVIDRDKATPPETIGFAYSLPFGGEISGQLTMPDNDNQAAPIILRYPSAPWERVNPGYDPTSEFLAEKGFAVVDFNGRGAIGLGKEQANLIRGGYAEQQAEDIRFLLDKLAQDYPVDSGNVALIGESYGGFGALFAAQQFPDLFKAVVAINAPLDPLEKLLKDRWSDTPFNRRGITSHLYGQFFKDPHAKANAHLRKKLSNLPIPSLFMARRGSGNSSTYQGFRNVVRRIKSNGGEARLIELHPDYSRDLPEATADAYSTILEFIDNAIDQHDPNPGQSSSLVSALEN